MRQSRRRISFSGRRDRGLFACCKEAGCGLACSFPLSHHLYRWWFPSPRRATNQHTALAPDVVARTADDRRFDEALAHFKELAVRDSNIAIQRLGQLAMRDSAAYDAYCARTKAHRTAQRQFILDHPGCIPNKDQRIRTLSALRLGVPRIETQALQWALLMQAREAAEARAARETAGKDAKKGGKGKGAKAPRQVAPMEGMIPTGTPLMLSPGVAVPAIDTAGVPTRKLPSLEDLLAERGAKRAADDVAAGFEALE
jgi:hypothetical protein